MDSFPLWDKVLALMSQEYVQSAHLLIAILGVADHLFGVLRAITRMSSMVAGSRSRFRW